MYDILYLLTYIYRFYNINFSMIQARSVRRPYSNHTLINNWLEERADVKNERIQKPLPSQVDSRYLIHSCAF